MLFFWDNQMISSQPQLQFLSSASSSYLSSTFLFSQSYLHFGCGPIFVQLYSGLKNAKLEEEKTT